MLIIRVLTFHMKILLGRKINRSLFVSKMLETSVFFSFFFFLFLAVPRVLWDLSFPIRD